jgi:hypothetical protein
VKSKNYDALHYAIFVQPPVTSSLLIIFCWNVSLSSDFVSKLSNSMASKTLCLCDATTYLETKLPVLYEASNSN